jgi:hypothetical protein
MKAIVVCLFGICVFQKFNAQVSNVSKKEAVCIIGKDLLNQKDVEAEINKVVRLLESKNYKVHKFYHPNDNWDEIKEACLNASIFLYRGHGTNLGIDGGFGGLSIYERVTGKQIAGELKFNQSPIVLFPSVCGGSGSSAGDETDIGISEARNRVLGSALPFFMAGAKAYYGNNYLDGVYKFLELMFTGKTLGEAFETTSEYVSNTPELNQRVNDKRVNSLYKIGISTSKGGGTAVITTTTNGVSDSRTIVSPKGYDIAFMGDTEYRIVENQLSKK